MTPEGATQTERVSRTQSLRESVQSTRFIGVIFVLLGVAALMLQLNIRRPRIWLIAGISTFLITPGVLYMLSGVFLMKRRYWAWLATMIMTCVLFAPVLLILGTGLWYLEAGFLVTAGCWGTALVLIMRSLRRCLPAVLEAESTAQHGFAVIPVAQIAEMPPSNDQPQ